MRGTVGRTTRGTGSGIKKLVGMVCLTLLFLAVAGCSVLAAPLTEQVLLERHYLNDYDSDPYVNYGSGQYQKIYLDDAGREKWSELDGALRAFSEEYAASIEDFFSESCQEARESRENYEYEVYSKSKMLVRRADEQVFSFLVYREDYTGGAHGYYSYTGYNFDPATGEQLTLADVFTDEEQVKDILWQLLLEKYPGSSIGTFCENLDEFGSGPDQYPLYWSVGPQGVTFIFNPYAIASYAESIQTVTLLYSEYAYLYTDRIGTSTGNYTCQLESWLDEDYDVDGDGIADTISVSMNYTDDSWEYRTFDSMTVTVNQETCTFDMYGYECAPMLMHTEDGRAYLYLEVLMDNDYRQIAVVDLNGGKPAWAGTIDAGFSWVWNEEDQTSSQAIPQDPMHFCLASRMNMLGTYSGMRYYTLDGGNYGRPETERFTAGTAHVLTTIKDLPVHRIDPATMTASEEISYVPANENLTILGTDGETYADLQCQDDTLVRVYVNTTGYPRLIEGEDEQDFFEMIFYAG